MVHVPPAREVPVEVVWQRPEVQVCPVAQRVPQAPQLVVSVVVSTHAVPHMVRGDAQVLPPKQSPIEQVCPVAQRLLQKPQLLTSLMTSIHDAPHIIRGSAQTGVGGVHTPPTHESVLAQVRPQPPQLSRSVCASTHDAPHITRGDAQVGVGE